MYDAVKLTLIAIIPPINQAGAVIGAAIMPTPIAIMLKLPPIAVPWLTPPFTLFTSFIVNSFIDIPDTLTSNNPEAVLDFYHKHQGKIISKMQSAFAIYNEGKENVVFTNPVKESDLNNLADLCFCPMQFQQTLTKELELRATVVGDKVFCIAINSNKFQEENYDWRKKGATTLDAWFPYQMPKEEERKLINLTKNLGLNYGAADYILTPSGELKFLEINPCGEFFWADLYQQQGICEAIANHLADNMS